MIGNLATDIVQLQSYISSDRAEAGGAERTVFTGSLSLYQLKRTVQKDRGKSNAEYWKGDKAEMSSLLTIHLRLRELIQGSLSVDLSFYQRRQRQIMRQIQYLFLMDVG